MHELAQPVDDFHLVRLQVPDEVPAEGVAVERVLPLEILRAVLADDCDSRLRESTQLLGGDVLRRHDHRDRRPDVVADAGVARRNLARARDVHGLAGP